MTQSYKRQIDELANFIMTNVRGEPLYSEGAIKCAIRLLEERNSYKEDIEDLCIALQCWKSESDVWERVDNWLFNCRRHVLDISPALCPQKAQNQEFQGEDGVL